MLQASLRSWFCSVPLCRIFSRPFQFPLVCLFKPPPPPSLVVYTSISAWVLHRTWLVLMQGIPGQCILRTFCLFFCCLWIFHFSSLWVLLRRFLLVFFHFSNLQFLFSVSWLLVITFHFSGLWVMHCFSNLWVLLSVRRL